MPETWWAIIVPATIVTLGGAFALGRYIGQAKVEHLQAQVEYLNTVVRDQRTYIEDLKTVIQELNKTASDRPLTPSAPPPPPSTSQPEEPRAPIIPTSLTGSITFPPSRTRVPRRFRVEGTVSGQPRHLWLAVRIGQLYWPKEPELVPEGTRWVGEVNEGGWPPGGRFAVVLVDVSDEVSRRFREWLVAGHRTGHYPGLYATDLGDYRTLDSEEYQLITD